VTESVAHPERMEIACGALAAVACVGEVRAAAAQLSCVGALLAAQRANSADAPVQTVTCKALVRAEACRDRERCARDCRRDVPACGSSLAVKCTAFSNLIFALHRGSLSLVHLRLVR
jgi:hypothetical protein